MLASGLCGSDPIVGTMSANTMKLWNPRTFRPAVAEVARGFKNSVVYTLRHSHASALHYAGFTPAEAAARMGHGLDLHWKTYAHVVESISGKRFEGLEALITAARNDPKFRQSSATAGSGL